MEEKDNIVDVESEVIEEKKVDNTGNSNQNDQSNTILFSILSYIGILSAIFVFIPVISFLGVVIASLFGILCFVLMIIGIVNAANKSEKPLPIIGKFQNLK